MTLYWLWVSAGCAASGLFGFSAVRLGARRLWTEDTAAQAPENEQAWPPQPQAPEIVPVPALRERPASPAARRMPKAGAGRQPAPEPTGPRPEAAKLALWARQVRAGERKMSIATDGCRVTWNRTCKHGYPSWLVHLGYLKRHHHLPRHNPR
jgi:hypothetical protein